MTNEILRYELMDFITGGNAIQFIKEENVKIPPRPENPGIIKIDDKIPLITIIPFPYIREVSPKSFNGE